MTPNRASSVFINNIIYICYHLVNFINMTEEEFDKLSNLYSPLITKIINSNARFYGFNEKIRWCFTYKKEISIMAETDRKTNVISFNVNAINYSYLTGHVMDVEYYVLHEIRHIFQHIIIKDYVEGKDVPIPKEIVERWIKEQNNYVPSLDENGNENKGYFLQDIEMDAFAFSYAVMKYKYKNVDYLYVPPIYGKEFEEIADEWIDCFSKE